MSPHPEIRLFEPGDRTAVEQLATRLAETVAPWRDQAAVAAAVAGWVTEAIDGADPRRSPVFVADDDGVLAGFASGGVRRHWSGEVDAYLGELAVLPECARRGVGRALVTAVQGWAREDGHRRITLETGYRNAPALALYEQLGYQIEEVVLTRSLR